MKRKNKLALSDKRMPSRPLFNYSALALGIIAASAPLLSLAGPDACQQDPNNPNAYQCSGDQTYGIDISSSSSNPPSTAQQITVNNLSGTRTHSGDIYGTWTTSNTNGYNVYDAYDIRWTMTDSGPTPAVLIVNTGTHLIDGNILADGAAAVQVTSQGANGQDKADQHSTEIIGHAGRPIQLTFDGTINPSAALGIMATSTGGMGGKGKNNETGGTGGLGGAVTVNLSGAITAGTTPSHSQTSYAVYAASVGGAGGIGGDQSGGYGGAGGHGGQASDVRTTSSGTSITSNLAPGVYLLSQGGAGHQGGYGSTSGGDGGDGGAAGNIFIDAPADFTAAKRQAGIWNITTTASNSPGLLLQSIGGIGGGGERKVPGGDGGNSGNITIFDSGQSRTLNTTGAQSAGIFALSQAGAGGDGDAAQNSAGGNSGSSGTVSIYGAWNITTNGDGSPGLLASSQGGAGGVGSHKPGGSAGNGGKVDIDITHVSGNTYIKTQGQDSAGILGQSVGGHAGSATGGSGFLHLVHFGASAGSAGDGGTVNISNWSQISTQGLGSDAIVGQSIGGGGGSGGAGFGVFFAKGGTSTLGGNGGAVSVTNHTGKSLTLSGADSIGILAQSIGGTGGDGEMSSGLAALGGKAGGGGTGGNVSVWNGGTIKTAESAASGDSGFGSPGILAQSIGGGGGHGGSSLGWFSLGGAGGSGGAAGTVAVTHQGGTIDTSLDNSTAILAQSIGGGGGNGGGAVSAGVQVAVAIGGAGGSGNTSGNVTASAADGMTLSTDGANSHGLVAQSIGGGGGNGGFASSLAVGVEAELPSLAVSVGGSGGSGAVAGTATASTYDAAYTGTTRSAITTQGNNSIGVFAQSVGGGGGSGGFAGSSSVGMSTAFSLGFGGSGGTGGNGSSAQITNDADITTYGDGSTALFAQSVGGGGGQGGYNASAGLGLFGGGIALGFGGSGGAAGTGGKVFVENKSGSNIITNGAGADGILAQSVGGGGGAGGMSVTEQVSVGAATGDFSLSFGGKGKAGGSVVDTVTVVNDGQITVNGGGSSAIYAQSVGGGGGKGGSSISGSIGLTNGWKAAVSLGGDGGSGGVGGQVNVNNSGALQANGALGGTPDLTPGYGIFAQSVGGGGGQGGYAGAWTFQAISAGSDQPPTASIPIALGGDGGAGNSGGSVTVTNTGAIATTANLSAAILAQSIGGGGGVGGNSAAGSHHLPGIGSPTLELSVGLGGTGGGGATGGNVTVTNGAALSTLGNGSHGIFAQSVGGGGGLGGHAQAENQHGVLDDDVFKPSAKEGDEGESINPTIALTIGGNAGAGSNGGVVSVSNTASITTGGSGSAAIFAQSVGGGGGAGSDQGNEEGVDPQGWLAEAADDSYQNLEITLGGNGGGASSGGTVSVTHSGGKLLTNYDGSAGIFAQSVGGGGGQAGAAGTGAQGSIALGGTGAAGGNGGEVDVTFSSGSIETHGAGITPAFGIFAQSVGGGGGTGGMGQLSNWLDFGTKLTLSGKPGSGGNGGAVNVQFTGGSIQTSADGAVGIFAQSVGGGGGLQGMVQLPGVGTPLKTGTAGAAGSGGAVSVAVGGDIHTSGDSAHGVFAQSLGTDGSGLVSVNVSGNIQADGRGSHGIFAQSYGKGEGAVGITIQKGAMVSGGGVSPDATVANDGAGIVVKNAGDNASVITNAGTISSASGNAIVFVDSGDVGVQNSGTITGNICRASTTPTGTNAGTNACAPATPAAQAAVAMPNVSSTSSASNSDSSITLRNLSGGVINAGSVLDVAQLDNQGTLVVAGAGTVGTTRVSGDLTQGQGGVLAVDLVPGKTGADMRADRLEVGGHAELAGKLAVQLVDDWKPVLGTQTVELVRAAGGVSIKPGALSVSPSAVARYHLAQPTDGSLHLGYDIHFANNAILAQTNDNQSALAGNIHALYSAGELNSTLANALIDIADTHAYASVLNSLSPEVAVDNQIGSLYSSVRFGNMLFNCAEPSKEGRFMQQGQCGWMQVQTQRLNQAAVSDNLGFNERSWQLAGGGQVRLDADWRIGGALSYENRRLDVNDVQANSDGYQVQGGLYLTRRLGAAELSGSLSLGSGDFDLDRTLWTGAQTTASQRMWLASTQLRAAYLIEQDNWYIKPRISLGADYLSFDGFNESGSSIQRLNVAGSDNAYVNVQPAVEFGGEIKTDDGTLIRPRLTLGVTQFIGDAAPSSEVRFAAGGANTPAFTASTELDRTHVNLSAGIDLLTRNNITTRVEVFGSVSDNAETYGGEVKLIVPF